PWKAAELICKARENAPIETTGDLSKAVEKLYNNFTEHKFLAKLYQALRIEVNMEMRALEDFLVGARNSLKPGGRLSIITYHSLEDRMVKNFMKTGNVDGENEKDFFGKSLSPFELVNRKPILPPDEEIASNTRSRSAKLRVAELKELK
ncbi:MAG: 16S rRNA (cytosine(1402)-N(4))-methyltransferase, partial [Bacteroidales bacterium]|nr:16S rRNA (cytosine(1402)-N(4))-methyltransferase [Bacteroidales bacterium]